MFRGKTLNRIDRAARAAALSAMGLGIVLIGGSGWASPAARELLQLGSEKQLFVGPWAEDGRDAHLVESMRNVTMTMNPAHVTGERLLEIDKPWEIGPKKLLDMHQYVLKDGDTFRMYYSALSKYPTLWEEPYSRILCYAESKDGIHWEKPNLRLWEWEGSRANNILFPNEDLRYEFSEATGATVFIDPVAKSPDEKYKMIIKMKPVRGAQAGTTGLPAIPSGQHVFSSPDGIHWNLLSTKVNPGAADTQFSLFWDERVEKYVAYTRMKFQPTFDAQFFRRKYGDEPRPQSLMVGRTVSDDLRSWSKETVVLAPDDQDTVGSPRGFVRLHFHGGNVSKYSEAPNVYIALPNAYARWKLDMTRSRIASRPKHVQLPGTMDVQLATSRDGVHWNRPPGRQPFIRLGPEGTFWSKTIWPDGNIIRVGDELWMYFAGLDVTHHEQDSKPSHGGRGRAVLRLDGFISADAAYTGGELTTYPLVFSGDRLQLNLATGAGGIVQVELQDRKGRPIPGYSLEEADEITGNYVRAIVSWKGNADVRKLAARPVKLRFVMRDAKLYSFCFVSS